MGKCSLPHSKNKYSFFNFEHSDSLQSYFSQENYKKGCKKETWKKNGKTIYSNKRGGLCVGKYWNYAEKNDGDHRYQTIPKTFAGKLEEKNERKKLL